MNIGGVATDRILSRHCFVRLIAPTEVCGATMSNTKSSSQFMPSACHVLPIRKGSLLLAPFVTGRDRMRVIPLCEPEFAATVLRNHREDFTRVRFVFLH